MSGGQDSGPATAATLGHALELPRDLDHRVPNRAYEIATSGDWKMASWHASSRILERRNSHRIAYHRPMLITPLDDRTSQTAGDPMMVIARDISLSGLSFTHVDTLSCRSVICTFEPHGRDACESVIVRLTWCRFTRHGYYQSGGKFMRLVDLASEHPIEWPTV